jgi:hypothetical protein
MLLDAILENPEICRVQTIHYAVFRIENVDGDDHQVGIGAEIRAAGKTLRQLTGGGLAGGQNGAAAKDDCEKPA